jgi:hypothetical protein
MQTEDSSDQALSTREHLRGVRRVAAIEVLYLEPE